MSSAAKYPLTPEAKNVHGRFARLYETGAAGKRALVLQCMAGGMMLKESGILETITMLDQHPAYLDGTPSERRNLLITELLALLGSPVPVHQPVSGIPAQPAPAQVVSSSPATQTPAAADTAPEEQDQPKLPQFGV
ncbi:hypothetical protein [Aeromonas dhakensis]|uniref:hypothetical protein n=1 Tax=Aeromonas dhakensis TaxID=196024 RepID=UPI00244C0835|nr:hypothetical protein [Aeromonas dhakensis]MDH0348207.1 hypothetical protein [Aeromonas dhakensis]